ncbi:hypothetical protein N5P37_011772 [Trichoderma harzianum]|nr:hypothetical protein N5P37_011772 [Trichoderma harzianum]
MKERVPRTRASLACESCQRRKVKCDAQKSPAGSKCTPCEQLDIPCSVDPTGDRRKAGSRKHVETLERRILELEKLLQQPTQHGPHSQDSSEDTSDSHLNSATAPSTPDPRMTPGASPRAFHQRIGLVDTAEEELSQNRTNTGITSFLTSCASVGERSSEMGAGADGSTSQNYPMSPVTMHLHRHHHHQACPRTDEPADLGIAIDTDTIQVKCRLLQSFFRYQPLWVDAVDEKLFWQHRESRQPSMWYSNFLEAVMLASATRLSSSRYVRSLGDQYASQAKADIVLALDHPSAASVQGFLMLSEYEVSQDREGLGWHFCGIACRMLIELGLHKSSDTSENGETIQVNHAQFHLLGACIALEGIWCAYLGRPSSISQRILQTAAIAYKQYRGTPSATLAAWMGFSTHMADICEVLNSSRPLTPDAKSHLAQLNVDLRKWMKALPPCFVYDESTIADLDPAAYTLQLQYCKVQILVYQASCGSGGAVEACRSRGYEAACRIVRLLLIYRQIHGTERIRSAMLDAVILALDVLVEEFLRHPSHIGKQTREIKWLRLAIENMTEIELHFPIVGRTLVSLAVTVAGTPLAPLFEAVAACTAGSGLLPSPTEKDTEQMINSHRTFEDASTLLDQCTTGDLDRLDPFLFSWTDYAAGSS